MSTNSARIARYLRCLVAGVAVAQCAASPAHAADPQPSQIILAEGGLLHDYRQSSENAFYYRLTYKGKVVRQEGKAFALPTGLNASVATVRDTSGDSGDINVRLERGAIDAESAIFDALGAHSLVTIIPSLRNFRGVAQANGQLEGGVLNLCAGLETPPVHPLRPLNERLGLGVTNWIIAGFQGQRRGRDTTGTHVVKESGVFTARGFFGRGFLWRHSRVLTGLNKELLRDALGEARTFEQALALRPMIKAHIREQSATPAENLIYLIAEEGESLTPEEQRDEVIWERKLIVAATQDEKSTPPDQPTVAVWVEGACWREVGRDRETTTWLNEATATLRWWLDPRHPDAGWISALYVNGFERAAPTLRRDQLMVTFGLSF